MVEEDDDGIEFEEEELESIQVSETEFNFKDFIKKWGLRSFSTNICPLVLNKASGLVGKSYFRSFFLLLRRFANPSIVRPYILMLRTYSKNTPHTNHCVVRMLHRLAVDLKMDALLFQLSVFHLFNKILSDPASEAYKVRSAGGGILLLLLPMSNLLKT